ncbi:unnamed protein product [Blepharisma stoltei]|uniref:Ubiquitin-like domain-containing protein n=1 Tax=Blepharisma stoltei TaxID=1481888 RepID=A0AAU9IM66_9CILI|nr:unnamed protein product [Blepharisma stoltei]
MPTLTIRVEDMEGNVRIQQVDSSWTYARLHEELLKLFENPNSTPTVICNSKYMNLAISGGRTLEELRFENNCSLQLLEKMKGGN